ncbi:sugar efflux transporter [compost metagenome]
MPLGFAHSSLLALLIGVLLLDLAVQLVHVSNQNAVIALRPEARNRLNAGYITCYFIGGALGSLLGTQLFQTYGWNGIVLCGLAIGSLALLVWALAERQRSLRARTA